MQRDADAIPRTVAGPINATLGDRWVIVGITRAGKTTFSKALLRHIHRVYADARIYIIDSKYRGGDFEDYPGIIRTADPPDPLLTAGATLVWQTPHDDPKAYDQFLRSILKAGDRAFVYIDELSSLAIGESGTSYPTGLAMLLKQGAGLGIGCAINTQEVAGIPRQVLNQATHLIRFPLELGPADYDARKIDKRLKRPRDDWGSDPEWYGFYYRRNQGRSPLFTFKSYRQFFKEVTQ